MNKDEKYRDLEFRHAVKRLVGLLKIPAYYYAVLVKGIQTRKDRDALASFVRSSKISFRTIPALVKDIIDGHVDYMQDIAEMDIFLRNQQGSRRRAATKHERDRSLALHPLSPRPKGWSARTVRKQEMQQLESGDTNLWFEYLLNKKKDPDARV